jgi:hypothetical protein
MNPARSEMLQSLAQRIREIESSHCPHQQPPVSLGVPGLDEILPEKHLAPGSLVELLPAAEGSGIWTLALIMAKQACGEGRALVIVDVQRSFYPPAALKLGIDLARTIVVRPGKQNDAYAAVARSLRCPAVGAVVVWSDPLSTLDCRRFQAAAEAGGSLGLLLRPVRALHTPSFAALRLLLTPIASGKRPRCIQVDVVRCRGAKSGQSLTLEIDDETGDVCMVAGVARQPASSWNARASG